jgi:urease accessory protein
MAMATGMITEAGLYRLLTWLSPAFPVGAYTYSHGIEKAVEAGLIRDAGTLRRWIEAIVVRGAGRLDAAFFCAAWRAVSDDDEGALAGAAEWADAMRATREMALESAAQGQAFLDTLQAAWPEARLLRWAAALKATGRPPAYVILHAFAANLVSAGVRLVPLGQTDGQRATAALEAAVGVAAERAMGTPIDEAGSAAPMVDWTSMQHETQYTRLFRT